LSNSRTINNPGLATYDGVANNSLGGNGKFNNLATGTFTVIGNNDIGVTFNNFGTFIKQDGGSGDGVTHFVFGFNNTAMANLQSGTLSLDGSDTSTGDLDTQVGTTLQFFGDGVHVFNAGADITARGLVIVVTSFDGRFSFGAANFFVGSSYTCTGTTEVD